MVHLCPVPVLHIRISSSLSSAFARISAHGAAVALAMMVGSWKEGTPAVAPVAMCADGLSISRFAQRQVATKGPDGAKPSLPNF